MRQRRLAAVLVIGTMAAAACLAPAAIAQHTKLSLESIGPGGGNGEQSANLVGAVSVGKRALISTAEPLVSADTDSSIDLYERTGSGTTLLTDGPHNANGAFPANFALAVEGGQTVFFQTEEKLLLGDTDNSMDVYRREGASFIRSSFGPDGGNGPHDAYLVGATENGDRVFIATREALVSSDTDSSLDIYQRMFGVVTLISTGPNGGNGSPGAELVDFSEDGQKVLFQTTESLVAADTDSEQDIYERSGGTTTLVSIGPSGGNANLPARFGAASVDGSRIFFSTDESLVGADTDTGQDVYERASGTTTIHSIGPSGGNSGARATLGGISDSGSRVFVETAERLNTATDRDGLIDVYESTGGTVSLITPGANGDTAQNTYFIGSSGDGTRVLVRTEEPLVAADTDAYQDIYVREAGVLTLLSTGPAGGSGPTHAYFGGASDDATRVFIETTESLVGADTDGRTDVYERRAGVTSLLSTGPTGGNGIQDATFRAASADGKRVFFRTAEALVSTDTDMAPDVYSANEPGTVTVRLDAMPDDAQDFSFSAVGLEAGGFNFGPLGFGPTTFQLDDDLDPVLAASQVFTQVAPGVGYSVSQTTQPAGWDLAATGCDDGSPVSNIDVDPGESVTCTFTEHKRGKVVVVLDSQPNDPQDFSFTAGGGLSPASFSLDDDSDATLPRTLTIGNVPTGSGYSLSQALPAGWIAAGATCSNGSPVTNITVGPDETVYCTFTNQKYGQIVVLKDAQPNNAQDFSFTAGGGLSPASFQLDDDSDGTLPNTHTFANVAPGSGYSVSETVPGGWSQSSAICGDGSPVSNIAVSPGETVSCTFVNTRHGQIVVIKDAQPDDPQNFSFSAGGALSPKSFSLDDDSDATLSNTQTFSDVVPNSGYSISETVPSGWDQTAASCDDGSPVANIDVAAGETVTCTFANRKRGTLVVREDAVPNDAQDFSFTTGGGLSPAGFELDDDSDGTLSNTRTFGDLIPGSGYSVAGETPAGWDLDSVTCDDGSSVSDVHIAAGETVTCTFVHKKHGSVTVVKQARPADPQDFSFTAGGGLSPSSFELDDDSDATLSNTRTFADLSSGNGYSLDETVPAGWDQASATCDDGSQVSDIGVGPGEHVTCTFTNRRRGAIVVVQDSEPDDPQDFSFTTGGGLSPASFKLDDDSDATLSNTRTFANIPATAGYSIAQTQAPGWLLTDATCDDGSPVSNIDVGPGETVTCTFRNNKRGRIVAVKDATPEDPQDFSFTAGGGLSPAGFSLDDDSDGTLSNTRSFNDLEPASGYSLAETVPAGWEQTGATCDDGSSPSDIDVAAGETVTCTFSNRKNGKIVVVKEAPDSPQDFPFTAGGGLSPASFSLDHDSDPTLSNTQTFDDVQPGSGYSVVENVPSGWNQVSATCSDGSPTQNIAVSAGETVTCTFLNALGYPRPLSASPHKASLVVAYDPCTAPNRTHGTPLDSPSCNPPVQSSDFLTVGTSDANSRLPNMRGNVRFAAILGNPSTPADEADVSIQSTITDVRTQAGLDDYTGQLEGRVSVRVTDRLNGPGQNETGTVTDVPFTFTIPCTATGGGGNVGATCSVNTTADAVLAGTVLETRRTIWQLAGLEVRDGGLDGLASTQDNTRFLRQGFFVP